jgi:hypothetical protein
VILEGCHLVQVICTFKLVDGLFDLAEGDGRIDGSQARFLLNETKHRVIDRSVVV